MFKWIVIAALLGCSVVQAGDALARSAQGAVDRRDAAVAYAQKVFLQASMVAEKQCILELQQAAVAAGKAGNTDMLLKIVEAKKAAEGRYEQAKDQLGGRRFCIHTEQDWQPTIPVKKGQILRITATGQWCPNVRDAVKLTMGADGEGSSLYLEGRIGDGPSFRVGSNFTGAVDREGGLALRVMDAVRDDNSGDLSVTCDILRN